MENICSWPENAPCNESQVYCILYTKLYCIHNTKPFGFVRWWDCNETPMRFFCMIVSTTCTLFPYLQPNLQYITGLNIVLLQPFFIVASINKQYCRDWIGDAEQYCIQLNNIFYNCCKQCRQQSIVKSCFHYH